MNPDDREAHDDPSRAGSRVHDRGLYAPVVHDDPADDDETLLPGWISWLQEFRFIRDRTTTADHIAYARDGAYWLSDYWVVRYANIVFAYVVVPIGILLCDSVKWAFFMRLSRCMISIPVAVSLAWALNHTPVTAWAVPDGWDITTYWQPDPATVEVPIDTPIGEG